jgi:hypothetical protein
MATREQEFSETRRLLDYPEEQDPSPDLIVAGGIRQEQLMMNELNASARGWSVSSSPLQLTSIVGQAEYTLYSDDPTNTLAVTGFGKPLFVYRILADNTTIVPVALTDYQNEIANQSYDMVRVPGGLFPSAFGEKLAFFRTQAGVQKVRIYPIPDEARVYKIAYAVGAIDPSTFAWTDTPIMPEWSHLRSIRNALTLLSGAEWSGLDEQQNRMKRQDLKDGLVFQLQQQEPEYKAFLVNPQHESTISVVGAWYDE